MANSAAERLTTAAALAQVTGIGRGNLADGVNPNARVNLTINGAEVVTLTDVATANGGVSPTTMGAVANRYDSLGVINLNGAGGTLLNSAANTIDAGTTVTGASVAGILDVNQNLTVKTQVLPHFLTTR